MTKYLCFDVALNEMYTLLKLQERYPNHKCLFQGTKDERIWDAAPWLFEISDNDFENNDELMSLKACIIFETTVNLSELCCHLQQFIYKKIDGKEYFFRFWDARVLEKYLQECDVRNLELFFEEIENIYTENEEVNYFNKMTLSRYSKLMKEKISVEKIFNSEIKSEEINSALYKSREINSKQKSVEEEESEKPTRRKFFLD